MYIAADDDLFLIVGIVHVSLQIIMSLRAKRSNLVVNREIASGDPSTSLRSAQDAPSQ
jgi:hypothetical protein